MSDSITKVSPFADNFWGVEDFAAGFQVLTAYMKRGRKECEDVTDYLKERAEIEQEYAKKLLKLAKSTNKKSGFGVELGEDELNTTLRASWKQIKESAEKVAAKHKSFADDILTVVEKPLNLSKESDKKRVAEQTTVVEATIKEYSQLRTNVPKLKKAYESKCKEMDANESEIETMKLNKNDKQISKLQAKGQKLQKEIEQADQAYKQGVDKLEETKVHWEEKMTEACDLFELLEINRVQKMKEYLTELVNLEERMIQPMLTEILDKPKVYLECIKPEVDVELFVSEKRTGYLRPGPTIYENYYTGQAKDFVFGVDITTHLTATNRKVPEVVELCVQRIEKTGIKDEGIYRLSGRQAKVQQLKKKFDKSKNNNTAILDDPDIQVNDLASLVKLYFRELPNPLLTFALYDEFIETTKIQDQAEKIRATRSTIDKLPEGNKNTLQFILVHLKKVSEFSSENRMGVSNLAIVFAPGLIRAEAEASALRDFKQQSMVFEDMIAHVDLLFL